MHVHDLDRVEPCRRQAHLLEVAALHLEVETLGDGPERSAERGQTPGEREDLEDVAGGKISGVRGGERGKDSEAPHDARERGARWQPSRVFRGRPEKPQAADEARVAARGGSRVRREAAACLAEGVERGIVDAGERTGQKRHGRDFVARIERRAEERAEGAEPFGDREALASRDVHRDAAGLESARVGADVPLPSREEEEVLRLCRAASAVFAVRDLETASHGPGDPARDLVRARVDRFGIPPRVRRRDHPESSVDVTRLRLDGFERRPCCLRLGGDSGKDALQDLVERFRERGSRTEARRQEENLPVPGEDAALEALVERDVGPPKTVDRLLRVADDEERARIGRQLPDVARVRSRRGQEKQELGLERIGVLELVDEEVRETLPEIPSNHRPVAEEIAREEQKVFVGEEALLASGANGRRDRGIEKADRERVQELAPREENGFGDRFAEAFRFVGHSLSRRLGLPFPLRRPRPRLEEGEDARHAGIRLELRKLARAESAPDLLLEVVLDGRLFVGQCGSAAKSRKSRSASRAFDRSGRGRSGPTSGSTSGNSRRVRNEHSRSSTRTPSDSRRVRVASSAARRDSIHSVKTRAERCSASCCSTSSRAGSRPASMGLSRRSDAQKA